VLPALAAVLVGAVTAGAATLVSHIADEDSSGAANVALSAGEAQGSHGGLSRPDNRVQPGSDQPGRGNSVDTDGTSAERPSGKGNPAPSRDGSGKSSVPTESEDTVPRSSDETQDQVADDVVDLVNTERAKSGCDPLVVDPKLVRAAQEHSADMAERDYFDHTTPEGLTFADRIVNAGYPTPGAENIAVGQQNADQVMQGWMDSEGHRANILNCDLKTIGVGFVQDGMYWTQDFGY
jgi:uncharacterized protein YkwD